MAITKKQLEEMIFFRRYTQRCNQRPVLQSTLHDCERYGQGFKKGIRQGFARKGSEESLLSLYGIPYGQNP